MRTMREDQAAEPARDDARIAREPAPRDESQDDDADQPRDLREPAIEEEGYGFGV